MPSPVSLFLVMILSSLMSLAVLGSLRFAAVPGVRRWMFANLLLTISVVLFVLQGMHVTKLLTAVVANVLYAYSVTLIYEGCRQFLGLRVVTPAPYIGCLFVLVGLWYWLEVSPDFDARVAVMSAVHAMLYAGIGWVAWRHRPARQASYNYGFVLVAAWIGAAAHALRGMVYGMGWVPQTELMQVTPVNMAFIAIGIIAVPALSIGMVMLAHDHIAVRLERLASTDAMTGALVRRAFLEQAAALLARAASERLPISLAIVDIDHFKSINDKHGHAAGDQVLARLGRLIGANLRDDDLFGRIGGEEFGILLMNTGRDEALARIESLRQLVARDRCETSSAEKGAMPLRCTFSAGVDEYRQGQTLSNLLARADAALYAAKSLGRDRVVGAQEKQA